MDSKVTAFDGKEMHRRVLRYLRSAVGGVNLDSLTAQEREAVEELEREGYVRREGEVFRVDTDPQTAAVVDRAIAIDTGAAAPAGDEAEIARLREEHQHITDLLFLIQSLTSEVIRSNTVPDLFSAAFRILSAWLPFDIAIAVMLEQNLDFHISAREGTSGFINQGLIDSVKETIQKEIPAFASAEAIVKSEHIDLPALVAPSDATRFQIHTILKQENRTAGVLFLFRGEPPFDLFEQQVLPIFSTQISMLLDNIRARETIQSLADTDHLTGVANRRSFNRTLQYEIDRTRVYNDPLALMVFDIDDFKLINDSHGHAIGDVVLSELCGTVRENLRTPDHFARMGGDEFAIILPNTDVAGACAVADRILERVRILRIPTDDEGLVSCGLSIGIAGLRFDDTAADLFRRADERLYDAKHAGKNRYIADVTR